MKFIWTLIYFIASITDLMTTSKSNANTNHIDFCKNIRNDNDCLRIINNIPPINTLPRIESSRPIPIEVIPYRKKVTSFRQRNREGRKNFIRNEDSYLYELR